MRAKRGEWKCRVQEGAGTDDDEGSVEDTSGARHDVRRRMERPPAILNNEFD